MSLITLGTNPYGEQVSNPIAQPTEVGPPEGDQRRPVTSDDVDPPVAVEIITPEELTPRGTVHQRHCTRILENGARCKRFAIVGGFVCSNHGGRHPGVIEAARKRLAFLIDPAIEVLFEICTSPLEPSDVRLRAANSILNRTGLGEHVAVDVTAQHTHTLKRKIENLNDEELFAEIDRLKLGAIKIARDERWRQEQLEACQVTIAEQERLGIPDRAFYDSLVDLLNELGEAVSEASK